MSQLEFEFAGSWDRRQHWLAVGKEYALALILTVASFAIRWLLDSYLGNLGPHITFYLAVVLAAALTTLGPALLVIALSLVAGNWAFISPRGGLWPANPEEIISSAFFLLVSSTILLFARKSKQALRREQQAVEALEARKLQLAASEEMNRRILASSADCINVLSLEGLLLSVNEGGKRLLDLEDANRVLRRPWSELWPAEHEAQIECALAQARSGRPAMFEASCKTARGTVRWFNVGVTPICDPNGRPERLLAISRDVTERRHAEEERRISEERRELAMAAIGDSVWDLDLNSQTVVVNENYERSIGKPVEGEWMQWWLERIHPNDRSRVCAEFQEALRSGASHLVMNYRLLRVDGSWGHVMDRAYIAHGENGQARRAVGALMDLTKIIRVEQRMQLLAETAGALLRAEAPQKLIEQLCQKVLEHLDCDVFVNYLLEEGGERLKLNACYGFETRETRQLENLSCATSVCGAVAREGKPVVVEDLQRSLDPGVDLVRGFGMRVYAINPLVIGNKVIGTLAFGSRRRTKFEEDELSIMKAVTDQVAIAMERQHNANELRRANEHLEARVIERTQTLRETTEQLNSFCYSVAHDLRAPLRTQTGFARLLLEDYGAQFDETGRYYLHAIMQAAERQSNIIQDLMAHVNVGRADLPTEKISMRSAISEVEADLELEIEQKRAEIDTSDLQDALVQANRSSLHLVLLNLVSNACKFVASGVEPRVRIWTEKMAPGKIRLFVQDNGIGIEDRDAARLFRMFQRLKKGDYPGTGMGLAIVKTAVERMGGTVGLVSGPGQGSRFWIELPDATEPKLSESRTRVHRVAAAK